ncbi:hypothetical protein CBM2634_P60007 [Cupriavidus taiwanensis]|uniref:Uncharacterized protein n=1 Tax=Cupriavidus taiwanensis TaxID=164546 RepID=A0A375JE17_9BURK|nr:hypothetical protein CBM2634_P60007 [Cupriavidus taiwanensis]
MPSRRYEKVRCFSSILQRVSENLSARSALSLLERAYSTAGDLSFGTPLTKLGHPCKTVERD